MRVFFFFFFFSPSRLFICFPLFFFIVAKKIEKSDVHCNCCRIAKFFKIFSFLFFFLVILFLLVQRIFAKQKCVSAPPCLSLSFPLLSYFALKVLWLMIIIIMGLNQKRRACCFCFFTLLFHYKKLKKKTIKTNKKKNWLFVISEEIFTSVVERSIYLMVIIFI